jgi:taurine dioxygenase
MKRARAAAGDDPVAIPEYQVRFRWRTNSVAIWDNRCTQHYAVNDFWPAVRKLGRAGIIGDRPV